MIFANLRFHQYYGDDYLVEFPTGSGQKARLEGSGRQDKRTLQRNFFSSSDLTNCCFQVRSPVLLFR